MFPIICSYTCVKKRSPCPFCAAFSSFFSAGEQEPSGSDGCSEASSFTRGDLVALTSGLSPCPLALHEWGGWKEEGEGKEYTTATSW